MDTTTIGRVVLMSIHPVHGDAILNGKKRVEFRKRPMAGDVTHVLLYATLPVGAIIGAFTVAGQETKAPSSLWTIFEGFAGIDHDKFWSYFRSHTIGTGIQVGEVFVPYQHVEISAAFGLSRPPQSYQYVSTEQAKRLLHGMRSVSRPNDF